ncbi:MAG: hypothetical protein IRZ32_04425 [Solirubrobacteraceae bacterium]|nr:hypothetical protein [Solirubrobacteraceae bacterium]
MPGEPHELWRARDPKDHHVEYGCSCMGYEIPGGLGVTPADPDCEVFVLVGDGPYLMMGSEIATAAQERLRLTIVLVQSHGFASIGARAVRVETIAELEDALRAAAAADGTAVTQVETDPLVPAPSSEAWRDMPVAEVAGLESARAARAESEHSKQAQRPYPAPGGPVEATR